MHCYFIIEQGIHIHQHAEGMQGPELSEILLLSSGTRKVEITPELSDRVKDMEIKLGTKLIIGTPLNSLHGLKLPSYRSDSSCGRRCPRQVQAFQITKLSIRQFDPPNDKNFCSHVWYNALITCNKSRPRISKFTIDVSRNVRTIKTVGAGARCFGRSSEIGVSSNTNYFSPEP